MARSVAFSAVPGRRCLHLAALLSSRICHDFAGNLSTVTNALQFARDASDGDQEALGLAGEAAAAMVHRLRLLRAAWGDDSEVMGVAELRRHSLGLGRGRLELRVGGLDPDTKFPADAARLVLNVMLLAAECLPHGGAIALDGDGRDELVVSIAGPRASWPPGFPTCLTGAEAAWAHLDGQADGEGRGLQCALTALVAHDCGLGISVLMAGEAEPAPPLLLRLSRQDA